MIKKLGDAEDVSSEEEEEEEEVMSEREEEEIYKDIQSLIAEEIQRQQQNRRYINDVDAMMAKLEEIKLQVPGFEEVPWKETLALSSPPSTLSSIDPSDDLQRERMFYDLALQTAKVAYAKMSELGIPYNRPEDFYAEMIKSDAHMTKIKKVHLKEKRLIEQAQQRTKARMDRKFVKKTQVESQQKRQKEKREEQNAIKKWRKDKSDGKDREFPEELLDKNSEARKSTKMSNTQKKALKYGMGGKRRGLKRNTKKSADDLSDWSGARNKSNHFGSIPKRKSTGSIPGGGGGGGGAGGKANRPGKRKRQEGWATSGGKKVKRQSR